MILALGLAIGLGVLLAVSPLLWPAGRRAVARRDLAAPLRERLQQAGLGGVSPSVLVVVSILLALVVGAVVAALIPIAVVAVGSAMIALALPVTAVGWRARARRRAARMAWPDVVEHLVSGLRAGLSLGESISSLAETGPTLLRPAFAAFERDLSALGDLGAALDELKTRLADPVADRIIETIRMAREVGGTELPSMLRSLAAYLRADAALRAEVEARQSWVRSAARLGIAAPWVVLALLSTRPEAIEAYSSAPGVALLVIGFGVTVVAYRIMIAIGRLPEERRWFS